MRKNILIVLSISLLFSCKIIAQKDSIVSKITKESHAFWDAENNSYSWYLNDNKKALWYEIDDNNRYIADFGDVIIECFNWKIDKDTIFFISQGSSMIFAKFLLISTSDSNIVVQDINRHPFSSDTVKFVFSNNQLTMPIPHSDYEIFQVDTSLKIQKNNACDSIK